MGLCYKPLWKILVDRDMTKEDLRIGTGLSPTTVALMGKNKDVSLPTLRRICDFLDVRLSEVLEYKPEPYQAMETSDNNKR